MSRSDYKDYIIVVGNVENPELITHLNYIFYVWQNTKNLSFKYTNNLGTNKDVEKIDFRNRINLIKLTYASLSEEGIQVENLHEYSRACSAWVAIKGYYLLFYLETLLYSLIEVQNKLNVSHTNIRNFIRNISVSGALTASFPSITEIITHAECEKSGVKSGSNLRGQLSEDDRLKLLMKKLREYAKEEYKRQNNLTRMTPAHNIKFNAQTISLSDFFYWYRIKSNYRDLEFIAGENAKTSDLFDFYRMYNQSVLSVSKAYIALINDIYARRIGRAIRLI